MSVVRRPSIFKLVVALTALSVLGGPMQAQARSPRPKVLVLRPRFVQVPGDGLFMNDERYLFSVTGDAFSANANAGLLIDDATGRRQMLQFTAGCRPGQLGAGRIVLLCRDSAPAQPTQELYDIASGQTTTFVPNPALTQPPLGVPCSDPTDCGVSIAGIGSDWVSLDTGQVDEHAWNMHAFQNLTSGQVSAAPASATTSVDLNRPSLSWRACPPLKVPVLNGGYDNHAVGLLTPLGHGLVIASGFDQYLERCGTHLHERLGGGDVLRTSYLDVGGCAGITCPPQHNAHAIVWPGVGQINGLLIPSRQRFTIPVPARLDPRASAKSSRSVSPSITSTSSVQQAACSALPHRTHPTSTSAMSATGSQAQLVAIHRRGFRVPPSAMGAKEVAVA